MPTRSRMEWALFLAHHNYPIIQLQEGSKRPVAGHGWAQSMTTDSDTIRKWFVESPSMNFGVCGGSSGVIIDIDVKKGHHGDVELAKIEADQDFDACITLGGFSVTSPSGGKHFYLRCSFPVANAHRFPDGIDVRGNHGYVVGPGSMLVRGQCKESDTAGEYVVESAEDPLNAPNWIISRLKKQGEKDEHKNDPVFELDTPVAVTRATDWIRLRVPAIRGQEGDKHTLVTAMALMDFGLSEQKAFEMMTAPLVKKGNGFVSWNDSCEPPWDFDDLARKVGNAWRYREERPGVKGTGLMEMFEEQYGDALAAAGIESAEQKWNRLREHTFPGGTIFKRNKSRDMVIPEWLPGHGMIANLAKRGVGKTVTMLDMALRLSLDMEWHGMPIRKGYYAIYICGEDDEGAEEQIRAWCIAHGIEEPPARFIFLDIMTDLLTASDVREWAEFLKDLIGEEARAVVFMDTWQRATSGSSQNDDADMQTAVHHAEAIGKSLNGPVVVAAHPSKANENLVFGSSIIENSTTAIWKLSEHALGRKLEVTRIKGRGFGNYQLFKFAEQKIGQNDEFGRPRTGIYPVKIGGVENERSVDDSGVDAERTAYATVITEIDIDRMNPDNPDNDPKPYALSKLAVKISELPEEANKKDGDGNPTPRAKWAKNLYLLLKNDGRLTHFGTTSITTRLEELFGELPMGHPMKDGYVIKLSKVTGGGKGKRFVIEKPLLDRSGTSV